MRAVIFAGHYDPKFLPIINTCPIPLMRILDKAAIIHIIESLVQEGVNEMEIFISHLPLIIEQEVGCGKRWGIKITYHLCPKGSHPFPMVHAVASGWNNEKVIVGRADVLPKLELGWVQKDFFYAKNTDGNVWGWGITTPEKLNLVPREATLDIAQELFFSGIKAFKTVDAYFDLRTLEGLHDENIRALNYSSSNAVFFPTSAKEIQPQVWVSRGASIHPDAVVHAPVFVGEYSEVQQGAEIGPGTVIENHCLIDKNSKVRNSLIFRSTYVGRGLDVRDAIVDRHHLINTEHGTMVVMQDDFLLSELEIPSLRKLAVNWVQRIAAACAMAFTSPILLYLYLSGAIYKKEVLKVPTSHDASRWQTFSLYKAVGQFRRLPILINIFRGQVHFVGLPPRTYHEVKQLSKYWRQVYLKGKLGCFQLSEIEEIEKHSEEGLMASEAFYSVHARFLYDLRILGKLLYNSLLSKRRKKP